MADTVLATMRRGVPLPYDAEVEWIDNQDVTGAYIDSGLNASSRDEWEIRAGIERIATSFAFWGAANDSGRRATAWITAGGAIRFGGASPYNVSIAWRTENQENVIIIKQYEISLNAQVQRIETAVFDDSKSTDSVYIGACNRFFSVGCRIYGVKLTRGGVLTLDMIPVRFTNELGVSEGAMYDKVSGQLFRNSGTGAFVVGPDKQESLQRLGVLMPQKDAEPTARDYVQDGLVAMWDGIENAGWGVHDQNATVWKDLVGSRNLMIDHGSFGEDHFVCNNGSTCGAHYDGSVSPVTMEVVFRIDNSYDTAIYEECHIVSLNGQRMLNAIINDTTQLGIGYAFFTATNPRYSVNSGRTFKSTTASVSIDYLDNRFVRDGVQQSVYTQSATVGVSSRIEINGRSTTSPHKCFDGEIKSIRLYSRALTPAEVAANYAIDKARFNLT